LITLEKENQHAQVARSHFIKAGLEDMVEIRTGDAHSQLRALSIETQFDFVFIDAEKSGYSDYFSWAVEYVRVGGIIAAHNVLAYGRLLDENDKSENIERMRHFNQIAAGDERLVSTIYPVGDGILAAVKVF
jgi:caffeoyl-CoA O-methyltransferase